MTLERRPKFRPPEPPAPTPPSPSQIRDSVPWSFVPNEYFIRSLGVHYPAVGVFIDAGNKDYSKMEVYRFVREKPTEILRHQWISNIWIRNGAQLLFTRVERSLDDTPMTLKVLVPELQGVFELHFLQNFKVLYDPEHDND